MATPTLHTINSYDVNNGITITFDANNGENIIRGSILEIYVENYGLLATHIYIPDLSIESNNIHVLPSKDILLKETIQPTPYISTNSYTVGDSVVYNNSTYECVSNVTGGDTPDISDSWKLTIKNGVGKLSRLSPDFDTKYINEVQLQYTIKTFVGYGSDLSTQVWGVSERSNKMSTWTLPNPTMIIDTIGTNDKIETTSYTIGITYNTNISSLLANKIYNPIKTIEFELQKLDNTEWRTYKTSGVVYNGGTMLSGGSYYLNYTFNGMINGEQYRIIANATSILGMEATAMSNVFIVDAKTYQLNAFEVNGDNCNGRIEIKSNIVSIDGKSNVTPQGGEINLTNNGWCQWNDGLAFTNNWTARFWVHNIRVADQVPSNQYLVRFKSKITNGIIEIYAIQDRNNTNNCQLGLYVYPIGYNDSVQTYLESNSIPISSITQSNPLCIVVGFDYDNTGSYFIKAII